MPLNVRLTPLHHETGFAPLAVLGYCVQETHFLRPLWAEVQLPLKVVDYPTETKLRALLLGVLAGGRAISQVNSLVRPDQPLCQAWGLPRYPDQSALARTLDAFTPQPLDQLRQGSQTWWRAHSRVLQHDFERQWLWLDIDLTPLPASKHAEASTKGKLAKRGAMGVNWPACMPLSITRQSSRACIRASRRAPRRINRP